MSSGLRNRPTLGGEPDVELPVAFIRRVREMEREIMRECVRRRMGSPRPWKRAWGYPQAARSNRGGGFLRAALHWRQPRRADRALPGNRILPGVAALSRHPGAFTGEGSCHLIAKSSYGIYLSHVA